jgi:hypothetical protein
MPRIVVKYTNPTLKVADTEAGLTTGTAFECQITSAVVAVTPVTSPIAATGCVGQTDEVGASKFALVLAWLDDVSSETGLTQYAWDEAGEVKWFELVPDKNATPTVGIKGTATVVEGPLGGTFGDGSAGTSGATWPCQTKPTIVRGTTLAASSSSTPDDDTVAA